MRNNRGTSRVVWVPITLTAMAALCSQALASGPAFLDLGERRGYQSFPLSEKEMCIVPQNLPIREDRDPSKKQLELCAIDFYSDSSIGICPKGFSTNPAVEVYRLPEGTNKEKFETSVCLLDRKKIPGDKIAKFKSTITCSYTPSILGYYQLSQFLDEAGHVPPSVIRTMDLEKHKGMVKLGMKGSLREYWASFVKRDNDPKSYPQLYSKDLSQVYGALSVNPGKEEFYKEFYGKPANYDDGMNAFLRTEVYKAVTDPAPVSQRVGKELAASAQKIQAMKDVSDLILMDTIMNQQDRFGNVHKLAYYQYVEDGRVKSVKASKVNPDEMTAKRAVPVWELLMKDNDCGVSKENKLKSKNVLNAVRHMSPKTYQLLLKLAQWVNTPEAEQYFRSEMLFSGDDWSGRTGVKKNILESATMLKRNCEQGLLKLDLSIDEHLGLAQPAAAPCQSAT